MMSVHVFCPRRFKRSSPISWVVCLQLPVCEGPIGAFSSPQIAWLLLITFSWSSSQCNETPAIGWAKLLVTWVSRTYEATETPLELMPKINLMWHGIGGDDLKSLARLDVAIKANANDINTNVNFWCIFMFSKRNLPICCGPQHIKDISWHGNCKLKTKSIYIFRN